MKHYSHLTEIERYQISALYKRNISLSSIARDLGRSKSTISRELRRNKGLRGYRPKQANDLSIQRKAQNQYKLSGFLWAYICHRLSCYDSPEQIAGRLKRQNNASVVSVETIYRFIYADKANAGNIHRTLRCQKRYRKRSLKGLDRRGQIASRHDINERPARVEQRIDFGDFEGDTVVGKGHKGVLVSLVDRVTRLTRLRALANRKAALVTQTCINALSDLRVKSITFDNGKEFSGHDEIAKRLNINIYFATPYHSWERGTNENTNGLIRQFYPKNRRLDNLIDDEVKWVEDNLNNRPRKVLNYLTPLEALARM